MKNPARKTFEPMLSPYVDGELSPEERQAVERHIAADKDSAAQVADFRAASGLTRLAFEMLADEQDFSEFANQVMARVTPQKLPLFERLKLSLSEMFTYQRGTFVTAGALAFALLAVVGTVVNFSRQDAMGYANPNVEVQTVSVDNDATVRPVVFETEKGDAIIWMVDDPDAKPDVKKTDTKREELDLDPNQDPATKKAGEL